VYSPPLLLPPPHLTHTHNLLAGAEHPQYSAFLHLREEGVDAHARCDSQRHIGEEAHHEAAYGTRAGASHTSTRDSGVRPTTSPPGNHSTVPFRTYVK
jgi:hypothetical protein